MIADIIVIAITIGFFSYLIIKMYKDEAPQKESVKDIDPFGEHFDINPNAAKPKK